MANSGDAYFTEIHDHINEYHDRHSQIFYSENIKEAVLRVMEQEEEEIIHNINNITRDTSFESPVTMNKQNKYENSHSRDDLLQAFFQQWLKNSMDVLSYQTNRLTK